MNSLFDTVDMTNVVSLLGENVPGVTDTMMSNLTSSLSNTLSSISGSLSSLNTFMAEASAFAYMHPYDKLKYDVYGSDFTEVKFKTLDDIPVPENFVPHEALLSITQKNKDIHSTLSHNITCEPHMITNTMLHNITDGQIVPDIEKHKKHIEFIELIKQMPIGADMSNEQCLDNVKKIISQYLITY